MNRQTEAICAETDLESATSLDMHRSYGQAGTFLEDEASSSSTSALPEEVLPLILSKTSARDVARLAAVSRNFAEAAKSDYVWREMLPSNYQWVAKTAFKGPIPYESLKELHDHFRRGILTGEGLEGYGCDPKTGELYLTFAARTLDIIWGWQPTYWRWLPGAEVRVSRFEEVAYLVSVCWLEVKGEIQTRLPPGTYSLSWVLRFTSRVHAEDDEEYDYLGKWEDAPVMFTFTYCGDVQSSEIEFPPRRISGKCGDKHERVLWRDDGWFEYRAGVFTVEKVGNPASEEDMQEVNMKFDMKEAADLCWKCGLFVDGVIIRQQSSTPLKGPVSNS